MRTQLIMMLYLGNDDNINGWQNMIIYYTIPKYYRTDLLKKYIIKNGLLFYIPQNAYIIPLD